MLKQFYHWLTKRKREEEDSLAQLHSAGATVRHKTPFSKLKSHQNSFELDQAFIDEWINPYHSVIFWDEEEFVQLFSELYPRITNEVISKCLGDFDWRTRSLGAFLAALKNEDKFIEIIGVHLLKSEVCYAGSTYAVVLAWFNDEKGNQYLEQYLDYYLPKKDLWFDQGAVLNALQYLDKINGTAKVEAYQKRWKQFIANKPNWNQEISAEGVEQNIECIHKILARVK